MYRFLILFALLIGVASADTTAKASIEKAWLEMDRAYARFDPQGSVEYMAPEFVMTFAKRPGMKISRDQVLQVLSQILSQTKSAGGKLQASTKVLSLKKLDASRVKVTVETRGTEQKTKGARVVTVVETREETWAKQGDTWSCHSSHVIKDNRS